MDSLRYTDNSVTGQFPGEITDRDIIHQMGSSHKNTYNALEGQSHDLFITVIILVMTRAHNVSAKKIKK